MIDRTHDVPLKRQAELVGVSRASLYSRPRPVSAADLAIMRRMDELHLSYPFAGSRMLRDLLRAEGFQIGRGRVITLMRRMGDRGLISPAEHLETGAGAHDFPVSSAGNQS